MQLTNKQLFGHKLTPIDGDFGHVRDFYFDDRNWAIRSVIVDTTRWLPGRHNPNPRQQQVASTSN